MPRRLAWRAPLSERGKSMRNLWKENKGSLIIEAAYVFPIMFFVLLFLIYMGNMFYMRSQVDAIVAKAALKAAAYQADPQLKTIMEQGSVPGQMNDIQPYHSVMGKSESVGKVREELDTQLRTLGTGFFAGMGLRDIVIDEFQYNGSLVASTFSVKVTYRIRFPIRFLGNNSPVILQIRSQTTVPVTDTPEFIQNVDMALDFADSTGVTDKVKDFTSKVGEFFK